MLVGDGAAAGFSIALGKGDKKQANKNVGNGLVILFCLASMPDYRRRKRDCKKAGKR
ncbi:hypothetical protein [Mediterraneibacter glycyrrhizinilyticus]|uniref:hypothetical protein n=1 Tax=Mediterraneibacter glycyrrhizinilyticus TaxID=342942 RepID=UPI0025A4BA1E|nr:hypothetical protein [Mediterraneibacter glycyrrhizinilyticus]MDM8210776.1 hypothetical protein [Mediterraneibacter glycyrrhizinilyticus]